MKIVIGLAYQSISSSFVDSVALNYPPFETWFLKPQRVGDVIDHLNDDDFYCNDPYDTTYAADYFLCNHLADYKLQSQPSSLEEHCHHALESYSSEDYWKCISFTEWPVSNTTAKEDPDFVDGLLINISYFEGINSFCKERLNNLMAMLILISSSYEQEVD